MDKGENIRKSFQNLKDDIQLIKEALSDVSNSLNKISDEIPKKPIENSKNPIYTSKPFITKDMLDTVSEVFDSGIFSQGEKVAEFEQKFAEFCHAKHAIAVSNGTVAIELILKALEIKEGDEIIVPSFTTMPTIEPILNLGAKPVFADIDERNYTISPEKVRKAITKKTKAIMPVHLYGNPADLNSLQEICESHNLHLIEDCAQAHNSRYNGKHVGTFGIASAFSFYPTKNLTVLGEGGMVITDNDELAKKVKILSSHGEEGRYNHIVSGHNYRLSEIHAAIGIKQLELLNFFTHRRRELAGIYSKILYKSKAIIPSEKENAKHSYHLYVIRVPAQKRDKIISELKKENIFLGIHYPTPCHKQKAVTNLFKTNKLPITEKLSKEIISLPIYPSLKDEEALMIANKILSLL